MHRPGPLNSPKSKNTTPKIPRSIRTNQGTCAICVQDKVRNETGYTHIDEHGGAFLVITAEDWIDLAAILRIIDQERYAHSIMDFNGDGYTYVFGGWKDYVRNVIFPANRMRLAKLPRELIADMLAGMVA